MGKHGGTNWLELQRPGVSEGGMTGGTPELLLAGIYGRRAGGRVVKMEDTYKDM